MHFVFVRRAKAQVECVTLPSIRFSGAALPGEPGGTPAHCSVAEAAPRTQPKVPDLAGEVSVSLLMTEALRPT